MLQAPEMILLSLHFKVEQLSHPTFSTSNPTVWESGFELRVRIELAFRCFGEVYKISNEHFSGKTFLLPFQMICLVGYNKHAFRNGPSWISTVPLSGFEQLPGKLLSVKLDLLYEKTDMGQGSLRLL